MQGSRDGRSGAASHRHTLCGNVWAGFGTPGVPASRERANPVLDEAAGASTNGVFTDLIAELPCAAADPWIRSTWFDVAWSSFRERGEIGADVLVPIARTGDPPASGIMQSSPVPDSSPAPGSPRSEGPSHSSSTPPYVLTAGGRAPPRQNGDVSLVLALRQVMV